MRVLTPAPSSLSSRPRARPFTRALALLGVALALPASVLTAPREARACGGCFAPVTTIQTVNSHRMVLSLSRTQTTLWDQFSYSGRPADFSWILPIQNGPSVRVRVADDRFMGMLDAQTAPAVQQPTRPFCGFGCFGAGADASAAFDAPSDASDGGAVVYRQEVVGPYDVAIIGGTDPMAIRNWLRDNGFSVPAAVSPVIDHYTAMRSDYIALRLRSGEGINRMVPVRITMNGYQPVLPLRMIAAGVADKVGLQLFVFADSRIEAMNFPNGEIRDADLVWDWNTSNNPQADFTNAFNTVNRANGGRVWLAESVGAFDRGSLESQADFAVRSTPTDGGVCPPDAGSTPDGGCMEPNAVEDVRVAFEGIGTSATVTRLRADLAGAMLDRDLTLQASTAGMRSRFYTYGTIRNTPVCPPPPDCGFNPPPDDGVPPFDATVPDMGTTLDDGAVRPEAGMPDGAVSLEAGRLDGATRGDAGVGAEIPDVTAGRGGCSVDAPPGSVRSITGLAGLCAAAAGFALRRGRGRKR